MDLGAYAQIGDLQQVMKDNGIYVPRLRGLRLMKDEEPMFKKEIDKEATWIGLQDCANLCYSDFRINAGYLYFSRKTKRIHKYYMVGKDCDETGIRWNNLHGKKRKLFKRCLKEARKRVSRVYETFNKYAGREDVLYIHARIGGMNWDYFDGPEIAKQPWFIEKVDDAFDCTYCDIYARIK